MIADLKADSQRWKNEREQAATRSARGGNPGRSAKGSGVTGSPDIPAVPYSASRTHEYRQAYGPSEFQSPSQPPSARPHAPYEEHGRTGQAVDPQQAVGWDQQTQTQYYPQHNPHNQQGHGGPPSGYPPTGNYSASEGYSGYQFTTPANTGTTVNYEASETRPRDPGYPAFPAQNPSQQQQQQQQQPYGVDQRTGAPLYAQDSMQNPPSSMAPPGTRHPPTRDHQYGRNDQYGGR